LFSQSRLFTNSSTDLQSDGSAGNGSVRTAVCSTEEKIPRLALGMTNNDSHPEPFGKAQGRLREQDLGKQNTTPRLVTATAKNYKNSLVSYKRSSQQKWIVIPGKLAVASATRNPRLSKICGCRFSPASLKMMNFLFNEF
jgi:hypothetical protein